MSRDYEQHEGETYPLSDRDLATLPFLDRVSMVEEIQRNYFRPQLAETFRFGLQETRPETIRLAEMLLDANRRREGIVETQQAIVNAASKYEAEKQAIRRGERGGKRIELKVAEAAANWRQQDNLLEEKEKSQRVVKDTVTDLFIHYYFLESRDPDQLLTTIEDLVSQSALGRRDLITLLNEASLSLISRGLYEEPSYLSYKEGSYNFVSLDEVRVLQRIVKLVFTQESAQNPLSHSVKEVAKNLIDFFWVHCRNIYGITEDTPNLAFIDDLLFAVCSTEDFNSIEELFNYFHRRFDNQTLLMKVASEYNRILKLADTNLQAFIQEIQLDSQSLFPDIPEAEQYLLMLVPLDYLEKWNPIIRHQFAEKYYDRILGIFAGSVLCKNLQNRHLAYAQWHKVGTSDPTRAWENYKQAFDDALTYNFPKAINLTALVPLLQTRGAYSETIRRSGRDPEEIWIRVNSNPEEWYRDTMSSFSKLHHEWLNEVIGGSMPMVFFYGEGLITFNDMRRVQGQNINIHNQIRNQNMWFVAQNGDEYHITSNPDLAEHHIRSLTFYPSPRNSGFRVDLLPQFTDENEVSRTQTYYIDNNGRFSLTTEGDLLRAPLWARLPFERFILDRLLFITSGALGQRGRRERRGEEAIPIDETEVRRSHWRTLTSTLDRVYTLTSQAAQEHAQFVLRVYGIDIYNENLRRRAVGTLDQDQCITFVQAVVNAESLPNQITFNSRLLPIVN